MHSFQLQESRLHCSAFRQLVCQQPSPLTFQAAVPASPARPAAFTVRARWIRRGCLVSALATSLAVLAFAGAASADIPQTPIDSPTRQAMQEAGLPYVSFIDRPNTDKALGGGGVIVRLLMDGVSRPYVLICAHEISPGDEVNSVQKGVFFYHSSDQQPEPGFALNVLRVRGQLVLDRTADLAVLAMGQNVIDLVDSKPGSIAPIYSGTVQVGDEVITVGAPHGLRSTLLKGEVTYTDRSVNGGPTIQTSLLATGGNSGGPVFEVVQDGAGNVGIALTGLVASVSADTPGVTFAIPLQTMIDFLARFGLSFDPNVHVQEARRMPHQATPDSPVLPPLDPRFPVAPAVRWDWSQP